MWPFTLVYFCLSHWNIEVFIRHWKMTVVFHNFYEFNLDIKYK
jgi:hypothetical protein